MTDEQLVDITYDNDPVLLDDPTAAADLTIPKRRAQDDDGAITAERDRILKYCVVISLILHVLAFAVWPRISDSQQSSTELKPGERRTPVRLVQLPPAPKKKEPPPKQAAAISDRDHTAEKQRLPKAIPTPKRGPLGTVIPQRMAKLTPPPAPEDIEKQRQAKKPPQASKHRPKREKATKKSQTKPLTRIASVPKRRDIKKWDVDLQPTAQDVKNAFARPQSGGSPDFYPDGEVEEAVVDINTREDRFFSYLMGLKRKIEGVWIYPASAARAGIGGTLLLEFVIAKNGTLESVNLLDSSGHAILDQNALSAIKSAAPYNPFPPSVRAKRLRIRANFIYVTSDFFRRVMR